MKPIVIVQGGQWGSEGKGAVTGHLCIERNIAFAIRTGAINAGHTVIYHGKPYAMQQIPCGWVNADTQLVIGPGAYIHPPTLFREIAMINEAMGGDVRDRLLIDSRCGTHLEEAEAASTLANRHHSIGATGKGCSEAIVNKIRNRNNGARLFSEINTADGIRFVDTVQLINRVLDDGASMLIEGTQGTHLDLHLGPYPYTTSRMTSAANWIAEAGLSPSLPYEVVLVCRTYPIRVAGNSGPMAGEIEWTDLARTINNKLSASGLPAKVSLVALLEFESCIEKAADIASTSGNGYRVPVVGHLLKTRLSRWTTAERNSYRAAASELHRDALAMCSQSTVTELRKLFEMTTVTKKLRRIAELNMDDLRVSVAINRPAWICLTFLDYVEPELAGTTVDTVLAPAFAPGVYRALRYVRGLESHLKVPVRMVTTGPNHDNMFHVSAMAAEVSER
jgi:adenylosuccinate synthase